MGKESLDRFISQFNAISAASSLLEGTTDDRRTEYYTMEIDHCCKIQENQNLLNDAIVEIENNLYSFPKKKQRIAYVKDLLRSFVNIAPYFDDRTETDIAFSKVGVSITPGAKHTMQVVNAYCDGTNINKYDKLPLETKYVIDCFISLFHFTPLLDAKCLSFDIGLQKIQNEVGIYIQRRRQWDILSHYGYEQKEITQIENQKIRKPEKPFIDYLKPSNKCELMKILRELLAEKKGRNVAAVIRALKKLDFIEIQDGGQKQLYRSMRKEFGDIGTDSGIDKYMIENNTTDSLRDQITKIISKIISKLESID